MPKLISMLSATALVFAAVPASATIIIYSNPGALQPAENVLFQDGAAVGNIASGITNQTSTPITFVGVEALSTPSAGQARIEALDGGLSELSFGLASGFGFREVEFNIFGTGGTANNVMLNFTDQFGSVFSSSFGITNGENFFSAEAIDNQIITNVSFLLDGNVQDARQFRVGGIGSSVIVPDPSVVPEPASWAMLIVGFGLVGTSMRLRSSLPVVLS
jgi:hypothetical protein